jgi:chemotaxis protein CheD
MTFITAGTEKETIAGMGELHVSSSPDATLACIGLGSCIAIFAYDPIVKVGGIVHVVLPKHDGVHEDNLAKYGDTALSLLIDAVVKKGAIRNRLTIKIVGGSQMTKAPGLSDTFKIGNRNLAEVMAALEREKMHLAAADTGGNMGRTARMHLDTGKVTVKTVGGVTREL